MKAAAAVTAIARPGRVTEEFQTIDGAEVMGSGGDEPKKGNCEPQSWQTFQRTTKPQGQEFYTSGPRAIVLAAVQDWGA